MQLASTGKEPDQKMSPTIYAALINSLFQDASTMFAGSLCNAFAALLTALKTGNVWLWPCVVLLVLIGAVRAIDVRQYQRRKASLAPAQVLRWEMRYQFGAMFYASALGLWCFVALVLSDDAVAHMIAISVTLGYVSGGSGRTYGRPWIFHVQMLLACGPMTAAMAVYGSPYYFGMALLNVVFFFALKHISTSLQQMFVRALVAREREAAIASQFDTALNNMPHGLCMFRADGTLAVMNHRFSEMMNLPDGMVDRRVSAADIVDACAQGRVDFGGERRDHSCRDRGIQQARDIITTDPDIARGRSLSWTFQPMADGGAVVLFEDITERRNAEARISQLARYDDADRAAQPRSISATRSTRLSQRAARGRPALGAALRRPRPVQAGQRHARPSLRRRAAVRGRRPAARRSCGRSDFVARFGGDEFVVLQQHHRPRRGCRGVLARRHRRRSGRALRDRAATRS